MVRFFERKSGTPQGGVISLVLANLFMHYAFDEWIGRNFPNCPWERYADDGLIHCVSRKQAEYILDRLIEQMCYVGLKIHPDKSKIVFCQKDNGQLESEDNSFTFLGYCFRPRKVKSQKGIYFMGFTPAVSKEAGKSFREKIRDVIKDTNTTDIELLSQKLNPIIRGWMNYYMKHTPSEAFRQGINYVNLTLTRWLVKTRKKVRRSYRKSQHLLHRIAMSNPERFYHWKVGYMPMR